MKQPIFPAFLKCLAFAGLLTAVMASCSKSSSPSSSSGAFTASIGGKSVNLIDVSGSDDTSALSMTLYGRAVLAPQDTTVLVFGMWDTASLNVPIWVDGADTYIIYYDTLGEWEQIGTNSNPRGTLTITSWNRTTHKISGNFNGVEIYETDFFPPDSMDINGSFNLSYSVQ